MALSFTIKDVAARAGVGLATASRVMNGAAGVSPATRQRVLQVAEALGYRPNRMAQGMVRGVTRTIGVVVPDISNPFFSLFVRGVEDAVRDLDYTVTLANSDNKYAIERRHLQALSDSQAAGLILTAEPTDREMVPPPVLRRLPIVAVEREPLYQNGDTIYIDNRAGTKAAIAHLLQLGHRRIGYIAIPQNIQIGRDRTSGYYDALALAGILPNPAWVRLGDFSFDSGYLSTLDLMRSGEPVTAIYAGSDVMGLGVLRALQELGLRIPADVAVVSGTGTALSGWVTPALTAVELPAHDLGVRAAELLLERIQTDDPLLPARRLTIEPRLAIRDSCGARQRAEQS